MSREIKYDINGEECDCDSSPAPDYSAARPMWHLGAKEWCLVNPRSLVGSKVYVRFSDGSQYLAALEMLQLNKPHPDPESATHD